MDPIFPTPPRHRRLQRVLPGAAAFLLVMISAPAASAASPRATPPVHPDAIALRNDCFVSTAAYLACFQAEFPPERAASLTVELRDYDGQHTIAVVSWRGAWWGRDSALGALPIGTSVAAHPAPERLQATASPAILPQASELFWVAVDREKVTLLLFRPDPAWVAVNDPLTGTARARCPAGSPGEIVKAVAGRLGYRAAHVRHDPAPALGPRVAAR